MIPIMQFRARKVNNYDLYANHAWYVPGVGGSIGLLAWFLIGNLLGGILVAVFSLMLPQSVVQNYAMLIAYPLSFLPAMVYVAQKSQKNSLFETGYKLNSSHFGPFKAWQIVVITVVLTYATMASADYINYLNFKLTTSTPGMKEFYDKVVEMLGQMTGGPFWSSFLLAAVFAPIFEEWLCRGMILRGLLTKMKPTWAIVISALIFAVIHMNPWQALNAFIIGVIMGYVYYKTGSLILTMIIHFVNNGTAVVLSQFSSLKEVDFWIDIMPVGAYIVVSVVGVIALVACLMAFRRIPLEHEHGNIDTVTLSID